MRVQKRVQELDVVRAISLIMIIIYHFNIQLGFHDIGEQKNVFVQKFPTEIFLCVGVQNLFTPGFSKYQNNQRIQSGFDARPKNVIDYFVVGASSGEYGRSIL